MEAFAITVGTGVPDDQLQPGTYPASLKAVVARTITVQNEERDVFEWTFLVDTVNDDGSEGEPIEVTGLTSRMTGPQSKTAAFLAALMGAEAVQPGVTFTMNDLVGKRCLVKTKLNNGGYAKVDDIVAPLTTTVQRKSSSTSTNRAAAASTAVAAAAPPPAVVAETAVPEEDVNPTPEADDDIPF